MKLFGTIIAGATALVSLCATAHAQEDTFFKGKEVTLLIGFGPGGGYDTYGRLLTRHLGKHLPGNPTVIAKNDPAAGGMKVANYIYNVAKKDGTELALFQSATALEPMFGTQEAQYDTTKFTWVGNMDSDAAGCGVWKHTGIKTWEDLKKRETTFGATGPGAVTAIHPRVAGALLDLPVKVITGYTGTRDVNLAMQRGEVDGTCGMYMSSIRSQYQQNVDAGELVIWMTFGPERTKDFPKVPTVFELLKNDDDRKLAELIFGSDAIGRPISAPPGLSPERTATLRKAFDATLKDPELLAEAKKIGLSVAPMTGDQVQKLFTQLLATPKPVVDRAAKAMGRDSK
jgi:tripartite-type tricarboxylate transporter receptor subunit TctC